jgi:GrpB-like predicted nucleotidyltransferase (UPF0157 family)
MTRVKDDAIGLARGAVDLRPYDPVWAQRFDLERTALLTYVPELLEVEHMGSTSIPGIEAKPVIDMQASLRSLSDWQRVVPRLVPRGYTFMAERVYESRVFLPKGPEGLRTHYLSLIEAGSEEWRVRLRFRDALRSDPALRLEYQDLKRRLARRHVSDRPAYTDAKSAFVARVLAEHP